MAIQSDIKKDTSRVSFFMPQNKQSEVVVLPRARSPSRDKAFEIYKEHGGSIELVDIAQQLGLPSGTIRGWKNKDRWDDRLSGTLPKNTERSKQKQGAPKGNKNALGHGAPKGNLNPIKHGAYQNIYAEFLPEDERGVLEQMPSGVDLDNEIQLLRLKIANLSNSKRTFFYDMFGNRHDKEISEEDRTEGILACTKQLEKLIRTQEQNHLQREKLELEKAKAGSDEQANGQLESILEAVKVIE